MNTARARHADLWGLVLAGGQSTRMGRDKGELDYRGLPHRQWLGRLLQTRCERVLLSFAGAPRESHGFDVLVDLPEVAGNGPVGALMSAQTLHPGRSWLVISCDLPYFDADALDFLLAQRDRAAPATAFVNPEIGRPEPLVTIYEAAFMRDLPAEFSRGERSMMRILTRLPTRRIVDFTPKWIESVDTPEAYALARHALAHDNASGTP